MKIEKYQCDFCSDEEAINHCKKCLKDFCHHCYDKQRVEMIDHYMMLPQNKYLNEATIRCFVDYLASNYCCNCLDNEETVTATESLIMALSVDK